MEGHEEFERLCITSPHDVETLDKWTEIKEVNSGETFSKYQKHLPGLVSAVLDSASVQSPDQVSGVQGLRITLISPSRQ